MLIVGVFFLGALGALAIRFKFVLIFVKGEGIFL